MNSSKILFLMIMITGTLISISANSWLSAWMGLEINLLSFIPLMKDDKLMSTESSLKYFLTQALASCTLLFAMIFFFMNSSKTNSTYMMEMIMFSALIMKMGSAPFHFWFPKVMEGLNWFNSLILMTWQKIAPLMLISYIIIKPFIIMSILLSSMVGAIGGLNQTSLRKLMAYSSINHLSWMLTAMYNSNILMMMYFFFYTFLTFSLIYMFNLLKISHINQLFTIIFNNKILKFFTLFNLLSLGGLPPFLGFFPKWLIIQLLILNNQLFMLMYILMMTLITLYFYIRLTYSAFMLNYFEINWIYQLKINPTNMMILITNSFLSSFGLLLISPLYFYL